MSSNNVTYGIEKSSSIELLFGSCSSRKLIQVNLLFLAMHLLPHFKVLLNHSFW